MTRQTKTPKQRAEQDLAAANRKVLRLDKVVDRLSVDLTAARAELAQAIQLRNFLEQHPALQNPTAIPTQRTDPTQEEGTKA